jgi:hypothetical protein
MKNKVDVIDIKVVPKYENGEYVRSNIYISHDGGQDRKNIKTFNQLVEVREELGTILADYIDDNS